MANTDQAPEPTMEEILASIRRIISDDDAPAPEEGAEPAAEGEGEVVAIEPGGEAEAGAEEEEVFELTDVVGAEPAADETGPLGQDDIDMAFDNADGDIDFVDAEEAPAVPEALEAAAFDEAGEIAAEEPEMDIMAVEAVEAVETDQAGFEETFEHLSDPEPQPVDAGVISEPLLSATADTAAATAFSALAQTLVAQKGASRTVEDLIQDLLRPMLKAWLDENLPGMVEQMVRDEIERVTRRSGV